MANLLEAAHQTIKAGSGVAAAAASMGVTAAHLTEILQGKRRLTATQAAALAAITGQRANALVAENTDGQLLTNRNTIL